MRDAAHERDQRQHHADEQEVAGLDAQAEEQQRRWNVPGRQPGLAQPARKAQAVHQPEGERHDPRRATR